MSALQSDVLPRAVARLSATFASGRAPQVGTAFLVSPRQALTCAHCVRDLRNPLQAVPGVTVSLEFTQLGGGPLRAKVVASVFAPERGIDVAVLELAEPIESAAILELAPESDVPWGASWRSFGYPQAVTEAQWIDGTASGLLTTGERSVLALRTGQAREMLGGLSGAPVLVNDRVVGVLSEQLLQTTPLGETAPAFDVAYAVAIGRAVKEPSVHAAIQRQGVFFVSYKREVVESALAKELHDRLEPLGHRVFLDIEMPVGTEWVAELRKQLDECDYFVPLLSEKSFASRMFLDEVRAAHRRRRRTGRPVILPVRVEKLERLPYELDMYMGALQHFVWEKGADTAALVRALHAAAEFRVAESPAKVAAAQNTGKMRVFEGAESRYAQPKGGLVPLQDPYYVRRAADEALTELAQLDGETVIVSAPSEFGKSSALERYLKVCKDRNKSVIRVDFRAFGDLPTEYLTFLTDLRFELAMRAKLAAPPPGVMRLATEFEFFVRDILEKTPRLVLAFDGVDRVVTMPYRDAFFSTLRSFHDKRGDSDWENLDLVLAISNGRETLIRKHTRSPFNVGQEVTLPAFDSTVYKDLDARFGTNCSPADLTQLHELLGGHPYLTRVAFYRLRSGDRLHNLESQASYPDGVFGPLLRSMLSRITRVSECLPVFKEIILSKNVKEGETVDRLLALGVVRRDSETQKLVPANLLFAQFFANVT